MGGRSSGLCRDVRRVTKMSLMVVTLMMTPSTWAGTLDELQQIANAGAARSVLRIDNDSLLLRNEDGFYSSGVQLERQWSLPRTGETQVLGLYLGQKLYTPSDSKLLPAQISPNDHPYAAWVYLGGVRETRLSDGTSSRLGVEVGCLGPCAGGEWTQTNLHRLLHQPLPRGWAAQLPNEVGVVLSAAITPVVWRWDTGLSLTPTVQGRVGNIFTDASMGLLLRSAVVAPSSTHGLHAVLRADVSGVVHDATLEGGWFFAPVKQRVQARRLKGELEAGLEWRYERFGVDLAVVRRSNEIRGGANVAGAQNFARIVLSMTD